MAYGRGGAAGVLFETGDPWNTRAGMASWSESRGTTLVLTHARGPDRYARVSLVTKRTLLGQAHNVREARAEDVTRSGREPEALGLGRMLSWRWLGEGEAESLLSARLRTLEALGYKVLGGAGGAGRGPWDWLRDLVTRQLERRDQFERGDGGEADPPTHQAHAGVASLRESLDRLGLEPSALIEGIATILELDQQQLREPTAETLRELEPELLELLLPVWLEHASDELREIGKRWLALPATVYEVDVALLERWVGGEGPLAAALAPRLEREGLALLGPEALARLAHTAKHPRAKATATRWRDRTRPPGRL
ncbi:hypothetical protein [Enhygromyxa salina]|uniref:Uncharacterized protein n=1 Tax=Enhygromyxa salina TaxID=215803 RepID=A0A2S9YXN0_9BACT|nr:hypothetical protein [Enhygromyxa salina]PRQ09848.1 hypothetical protein ENSA7_03980 [Enhygromyxa salina]